MDVDDRLRGGRLRGGAALHGEAEERDTGGRQEPAALHPRYSARRKGPSSHVSRETACDRGVPGRRGHHGVRLPELPREPAVASDRKSTRLNSTHQIISYAVFCLKKKK